MVWRVWHYTYRDSDPFDILEDGVSVVIFSWKCSRDCDHCWGLWVKAIGVIRCYHSICLVYPFVVRLRFLSQLYLNMNGLLARILRLFSSTAHHYRNTTVRLILPAHLF